MVLWTGGVRFNFHITWTCSLGLYPNSVASRLSIDRSDEIRIFCAHDAVEFDILAGHAPRDAAHEQDKNG